jgi:hypothetical protein
MSETEWDHSKGRQNIRKHGVSFGEASSVFDDPLAVTAPDTVHSDTELRFTTVGMSNRGRLLVVTTVEWRGSIRVISAWRATKRERHDHEEA